MGSELRTSSKMNKSRKLNLPWDFSNILYPWGSIRHSEENTDHFFILYMNLFNKRN